MASIKKLGDGIYFNKKSDYRRDKAFVGILSSEIVSDPSARLGVNRITLHEKKSLEEKFKLPLPWENILEGTPYSAEDARDANAPLEDKAQMALAAQEYDGYGKEWSDEHLKRSSHKAQKILSLFE